MKTKLYSFIGRGAAVSLFSTVLFAAPHAFAAAKTWTGATNNNFSTASNWSPSGVPSNGDSLTFDNTSLSADQTLNNDLTNFSGASLTFSGNNLSFLYALTGNSLTLTNGITVTTTYGVTVSNNIAFSGSQIINTNGGNLTLDGIISGSGDITKNGPDGLSLNGNNASYSGNITASDGGLYISNLNSLGNTSGGTTIASGASILFDFTSLPTSATFAEPLSLAGNGLGSGFGNYAISSFKCISMGCVDDSVLTFSGPVTLTANTEVAPIGQMNFTGALSGAFTLKVAQGWPGPLNIQSSNNTSNSANGTYHAPQVTTTLSDDQSGVPISIGYNETVIVTGKRQDVNVDVGGVLKGTGTVASVFVATGATIAPGMSPGCLSTGDMTIMGTYQVDIGGTTACSGYDQLKVTGAVDITGATLTPSLYGGFTPAVGQSYTIIDNDASDAVTGTFTGIAEGGTITADGVTYTVTYKGGDGNDVVLTVKSVTATPKPKAPDTGMMLIKTNPLASLAITSFAGLSLIAVSKQNKSAKRK